MDRSRMFGGDNPKKNSSQGVGAGREKPGANKAKEKQADLPPIPTGMQNLLRLASVDNDFCEALVRRRDEMAEVAEIKLTMSERAMLRSITGDQIRAMAGRLPEPSVQRRTFLRQTARAAVLLLGGVALKGCSKKGKVAGTKPHSEDTDKEDVSAPEDTPPEENQPPVSREKEKEDVIDTEESQTPESSDNKDNKDDLEQLKREDTAPSAIRGIRPDRPNPYQPPPDDRNKTIDAGVAPIKRPDRAPITKGIQPDRPLKIRKIERVRTREMNSVGGAAPDKPFRVYPVNESSKSEEENNPKRPSSRSTCTRGGIAPEPPPVTSSGSGKKDKE